MHPTAPPPPTATLPAPLINTSFNISGDAGESYYLIVSGTVDVMIEEGGAPKYLNILKSGQGFGEVALVNKVLSCVPPGEGGGGGGLGDMSCTHWY